MLLTCFCYVHTRIICTDTAYLYIPRRSELLWPTESPLPVGPGLPPITPAVLLQSRPETKSALRAESMRKCWGGQSKRSGFWRSHFHRDLPRLFHLLLHLFLRIEGVRRTLFRSSPKAMQCRCGCHFRCYH